MKETISITHIKMNLNKPRKDLGLTLQDISDFLGCDLSTTSLYCSGKRVPSIRMLCKLSVLFETPMQDLVEFEYE